MSDPIELALAKQANDAIAKGADGNAVTERLHRIIGHLRSNPDLAQQGSDAIAKGADIGQVASRIYELSQSDEGFGGHGTGRSFGDTPSFSATMLDAIPFGTKTKAATDAALFGGTYDQRLGSAKAGIEEYRRENPKKAIAATLLGAAAPAVATLGASLPEEGALLAPKATLAAKMFRGMASGAGYGALQGASEAHGSLEDYEDKVKQGLATGGVIGAVGSAAGAGIAAAARKTGIPRLLSNTAARLASKTEEGGPVNRILTRLAQSLGDRGEANTLVGQRSAMDRAAGFTPNDMRGVPVLALDQAGPNTEKLAQGIVHGPAGPGQAQLVGAMNFRAEQMKPSITKAITEGTGVAPGQGMEPLRNLIKEQSAEADQLYGAARKATEGQAVKSPTLDAVMQSPVGKQAYAWAVAQKANRLSPMPTANAMSPDAERLAQMGVPHEKIIAALGDQAVTPETVPDPETLHYMKQYLANVAKLGVRDGAEGKLATQAQGAVSVWGMIRGELPPEWQAADQAFAHKAKMIGAMNEGRNVFRTQVNPAGRPRAAVQNSLDALEQRTAKAAPDAQQATRTGVGMAAQERAAKLGSSVKSPGRIFGGEANEARMRLGFQDPEKAQQFQRLVSAWDQIQAQNQRILGNSATGGRVAEQAARAPDQATAGFFRELVHGNFGRALSTIGGQASSAAEKAHRVEVDREIANILTSKSPDALDEARLAALLRLRLGNASTRLLPRLAASDATADRH